MSEWVEFNAPLDTIQVISEAEVNSETKLREFSCYAFSALPAKMFYRIPIKKWRQRHWRRGTYGERGARAYNGGLGAESPAGSRVRALGQGVSGRSPPEAESFATFGRPTEAEL